jgi:predicted unusual protein kinase regulating ubiquinone biosynthesis (AarF/ABC1/UbiB family)
MMFIFRLHSKPPFIRSSPFSPEIWQKTMGVLQDKCPEEDFETIKAIVSKELDFDNVFASFEESPIGAASIGQGKV